MCFYKLCPSFFFFNDTATTEIYTLSLHDALPICQQHDADDREGRLRGHGRLTDRADPVGVAVERLAAREDLEVPDRKSTRLNSSHANISYAVFCLKKKNNNEITVMKHVLE